MAVVALVWSYVTDFAISRGLSVVVARKLNTGVGEFTVKSNSISTYVPGLVSTWVSKYLG